MSDAVQRNIRIEEILARYPDLIYEAEVKAEVATLEREKKEATLYLRFKERADVEEKKVTQDEIKALVRANPERYEAVMDEIKAKAEAKRLYERLLAAKKLADIRTAF